MCNKISNKKESLLALFFVVLVGVAIVSFVSNGKTRRANANYDALTNDTENFSKTITVMWKWDFTQRGEPAYPGFDNDFQGGNVNVGVTVTYDQVD